jgi:glycosyltransferase involved in cell wall biosynthesis
MRLLASGFVNSDSGSVASANAVLLFELLKNGHKVNFFSKLRFVDPRKDVQDAEAVKNLTVTDCTNRFSDGLWSRFAGRGNGLRSHLLGSLNARLYNRLIVKTMERQLNADVDFWMGDWARGRSTRPVVSYVQGPPATDADSIQRHKDLIITLAGKVNYLKLRAYAIWRQGLGLPSFSYSDAVIVGSQWSKQRLIERFSVADHRIYVIPYPIELGEFQPAYCERPRCDRLRLLWLGRFVPRKRLDLFLRGLELAIREGCDVEACVIGQSGFVPNYERLIYEFPFPDRLKHRSSIPRVEVPALFAEVDVLAQPSDSENFGSSVAEGLACGVPAIVGRTNGTGDYVCERSIRLMDERPETFANAVIEMARKKKAGELVDRLPSRRVAEHFFDPKRIGRQLESILREVASQG